MGILVNAGIASAFSVAGMRSTFFQKLLICIIAGFFAACLIQWGKVFVEGADDALNGDYKKDQTTMTNR
jgi:hypothetical protein